MWDIVLGLIGGFITGLTIGIRVERTHFRSRFYYVSPLEICKGCHRRPDMDGHGERCPVHALGIK